MKPGDLVQYVPRAGGPTHRNLLKNTIGVILPGAPFEFHETYRSLFCLSVLAGGKACLVPQYDLKVINGTG